MNRKNQKGAVAIVVALTMLVLLGFGAFGIDISYWMFERTRMQKIADAAALSCVINSSTCQTGVRNPNTQTIITNVSETGVSVKTTNTVTCPVPASQSGCVEAVASITAPSFLGVVFGRSSTDISATAIAGRVGQATGCMMVLSTTDKINGNPEILGSNCTNYFGRFGTFPGKPLIQGDANYYFSGTDNCGADCSPPAVLGSGLLTNPTPLANIVTFSTANPRANPGGCGNDTCNLSPGYYATGIDCSGSKSDCRLASGNYFLDGPIDVANNGKMTGSGVFFYMRGTGADGSINFTAGAEVNLTNAGGTTGTCAATNNQLLFYSPSAYSDSQVFRFQGGAGSVLRGNVSLAGYFMDLGGNASTTINGTIVVGKLETSGTVSVTMDPSVLSCKFGGPGGGRPALLL